MITGIAIVSKVVRRAMTASLVIGVVVSSFTTARADVVGEQVIYGDVTFIRQGRNLFIHAGNNSIINYQSFNISIDELVQFIQPGASSRVLNRILGPDPSQINGTLLANGLVYFANPAGVIFGNGAVINVGGIYAAAGNITDANFLSGIDQFQISSGSVINYGSLRGEAIHLIGRHVANHGQIIAPRGLVTMLAGDSVFIGEVGGNLLVRIDGRYLNDSGLPSAGQSSPDLNGIAGVVNTGTINSDQGNIVIGAGDLYSLGIHNIGALHAAGGNISVQAADGAVHNEGVISTSSLTGDAGSILVQGPSIINQGEIRADSDTGNAGSIEFTSQNHTYLTSGSLISAAGLSGFANGGDVLIHSYQGLTFFSEGSVVDVSGGFAGGTGGFAEVSGMNLTYAGDVNLWSQDSLQRGTLLLDPFNLTIEDVGVDDGLLTATGLNFDNPDTITDAVISDDALEALLGVILLQAVNDLTVNFEVDLSLNSNAITLEAGNDVIFNASILNASSLTATADAAFAGFPSDSIGDLTVANGINLSAGTLSLTGGTINLGGVTTSATAGNLTLTGNVEFTNAAAQSATATGILLASGTITKAADNLFLSGTSVTLTGNAETTLGRLEIIGPTSTFGNLSAGTNLILQSAVTFDSAAAQSVTAGGILIADSSLTKGANNLALSGTTVTLVGNAEATLGSLDITGPTSASGNLNAGTDLILNNAVTFDAAGAQSATAGGTLEANSTLTKGTNDLSLSGGVTTFRGDVEAILGALDITGSTIALGNLSAGTNLTLNDTVNFNSTAAQSVTAGGTLLANGFLFKGLNDLSLSGSAVTLTNLASANSGSLTITGPTSTTGNLSAGTDLILNNAVTFDAAGAQSATAGGILLTNGTLTKGDNDLTVSGGTAVDLNGAVLVSNGQFSSTGGTFDNTGGVITASTIDIAQAGDVLIGSDLISNNVTVISGSDGTGNLTFGAAGPTIQGDRITMFAGDDTGGGGALAFVDYTNAPTFQGSAGAGTNPTSFRWEQDGNIDNGAGTALTAGMFGTGNVTGLNLALQSNDGTLTVSNSANVADSLLILNANGNLTITPAITVQLLAANSGSTLSAASTLTASTSIMVLTGTTVTLADNATATLGSLTINGPTTASGNLSAGTNLTLNHAVTFDNGAAAQSATAGGTLLANSTLTKAANNLSLSGATVTLTGDAAATLGDLVITGPTSASGNLSAGTDLTLNNAVTFDSAAAQSATAGGTLLASGTLTKGVNNLAVSGGTAVDLDGAVLVSSGNFNSSGGAFDNTGGMITASTIAIIQDGDVLIGSNLISSNVVSVLSGIDGSGNLTFGAGPTIQGNVIQMFAGDDFGGGGSLAFVDYTNNPTFQGTAGVGTNPGIFRWRQDANLDNGAGTALTAGMFGTGNVSGLSLFLRSFEGNLTINNSANVADSRLRLNAINGNLTITPAITVQSLTATSGSTLAAASTLTASTGDMNLTGTTVTLADNATATLGSLAITGPASVSGNLSAGTDLTLNNAVTFDAAGAQSATAGGILLTNGTLSKGANDLSLSGGTVDLGANVTVSNGDFFSSGGAFDNTGGVITASNIDINHADDVNIANDLISSNIVTVHSGNDGTGDLTFAASPTIQGNAISMLAGDGTGGGGTLASVDYTNNPTFQGTGGIGTNPGTSFVWGQDGNLDNGAGTALTAGMFGTGNVNGLDLSLRSDDGTLTVSNSANVAASLLTLNANGDLTITPAITVQSLDATSGSTLAATSTLTASTGDMNLTGGTVTLATDATATLGSLAITGSTTASGDLSAGTNLTLNNAVNFNSAAAQSATAGGSLLASGILTKGANDLSLSGASVTLSNNVTATLGSLAITGPTSASGNLSAGTNLALNNAVTFDSGAAQSATAGGTLLAGGTLTKGTNDLTLSGTTAVNLSNAVSAGGDLAINGPTTANGNLTAGTNLIVTGATIDLNGALNQATFGNLTLAGPANVFGDLSAGGNLTLNNAVTFDNAAAAQSATAGLTLTASNTLAKADTNLLTLSGTTAVSLGNTVTAGGSLAINGPTTAAANLTAGNDLTITGASIDLNGALNQATGDLTLAGPANVFGDLSAGNDLNLNNAVAFDNAAAAQSATAGGTLTAGSTLTKGANDLSLSGAAVTLTGNAAATLGSLAITGPTSASGNLSAGTNLTLNNAVTFDSGAAQSATAGGTLLASSTLTKGANNLTVSGGTAVDLDGAVLVSNGNFNSSGGAFDNTGGVITASSIDINQAGDVIIGGNLIASFNLDVASGNDGTGDLTFGAAGLTVQGLTVTMRAGDDFGGGGSLAFVDYTNNPTFQGPGGGGTNPGTFRWRQDANLDNGAATALTAGMFGTGNVSGLNLFLRSFDGNLTINNSANVADSNLRLNAINGNLTITPAITVQSLTASTNNILSASSSLTATTGNISLLGGTVSLANNATATLGSLTITGPSTVTGDLSAGTNVTLNDTVNFDSAAAQSVTAGGTLLASGTLSKDLNDLVVSGGTAVDLDANVTVSNGNFISTGGTFDNTGSIITAENIALDHEDDVLIGSDLISSNNVTVVSGNDGIGNVTFGVGGPTIQGEQISMSAGDSPGGGTLAFVDYSNSPTFQGTGGVGTNPLDFEWIQDASLDNGALTALTAGMFGTGNVNGLALRLDSLDGTLTVSNSTNVADSNLALNAPNGNLTISTAITVQSLSASAFGNSLSATSTLTATTGNISLIGNTAVTLDDDTTATLGNLTITGPTTASGNLSAGTDLTLNNAVTFDAADAQSVSAGNTLQANGSLTKGTNDLTLTGTTINLDGDIATGGGQTYQGAVNILSNITMTSTGSGDIHFEGIASTLDGGFDFTVVNDDGDLVFDGDIGSINELESFTADVNHTTNDVVDFDLIIFNNTMLIADNDILLNTNGDRPVVPAIATIVALNSGGMHFRSGSGNFKMGQNEKMTIFGTLNIEAALTATLGDLTTLNDMIVTANSIVLRRRVEGPLLDTDGNLILDPEDDLGVDYVTGGIFNFSVVPTMDGGGGGNAIFGSLKGEGDVSANDTLKTFTMRAFLEPLQSADLLFGLTVLDVPPTGSTITDVSEALAAAMPREPETEAVPQETPIGSTELQRLRDLGINARRLMQDEYIHNATLGLSVFNDSRTDVSQILEVTDKRLLNDRVRQVVEKYDELVGSGAEPGDDRRARIRDLLIQARIDFVTSRPDRELSPGAMRTLLRDPKYQEAREYFDLLTSLLNDVKLLGLTRREYRDVETYLLKDIESTFLDTDYLRQILFTDPGLPDDESTLPDDSK